ncbi:MAG: tryptophan-rich sensory protein, partial [Culicoidibacterales bacterium]
MKKPQQLLRISVIIAYLLVILINTLANALPINGIAANEVSDLYANLFAPAGIAFSIWGVIFLTLGIYIIAQLPVFQKRVSTAKNELLNTIAMYFVLSSVINVTWVFTWHYQWIWLSVILMIALLASLLFIAKKIQAYTQKEPFSAFEQLSIRVPFSLYVGWITVATIANVTTFLVSIGFTGFGIAESW